MFDVLDRAGAVIGGDFQRARQRWIKRCGGTAGQQGLDEFATVTHLGILVRMMGKFRPRPGMTGLASLCDKCAFCDR